MTEAAECSLLDLLDAPEVEPSSEWVAAVTSRPDRDAQPDRAEQALAAQQRAEATELRIADLRARRSTTSRDDEAVGVLMAAFNVKAERAFECLAWASEQSGAPLTTVIQEFMARIEALGAEGHSRRALLGLLSELAGRTTSRVG